MRLIVERERYFRFFFYFNLVILAYLTDNPIYLASSHLLYAFNTWRRWRKLAVKPDVAMATAASWWESCQIGSNVKTLPTLVLLTRRTVLLIWWKAIVC